VADSLFSDARQECDDLLDTVVDALGCIDIGRGDREHTEAIKAVARLREILELDRG